MEVTLVQFLVFAAVVIVAARGGFAFLKKIMEEASAPPVASAPPPMPRRVRRGRQAAVAPVAPVAPEPVPAAPAPAAHLDETSLVVTRPARAHARGQFRGASALRQAIVAREVLGPPLSLRPPRF